MPDEEQGWLLPEKARAERSGIFRKIVSKRLLPLGVWRISPAGNGAPSHRNLDARGPFDGNVFDRPIFSVLT